MSIGSIACALYDSGEDLGYACPPSGALAPLRVGAFGPDATGVGGASMRGPGSHAPIEVLAADLTEAGGGCYVHRVPAGW